MKVLVCGGAGYIGAHLVREILRAGWQPVVLDSLVATHGSCAHMVPPPPAPTAAADAAGAAAPSIPVEVGDVRDEAFVDGVFARHQPDAVVHMCASIVVPDSVRDPLTYYDNNVVGTLRLLQAMRKHRTKYVVLSSTAALFGTTKKPLIEPEDTLAPESPYCTTKLVAEWILRDCDVAYGIKHVALRYFNACGADCVGDIGETHEPETHLIPLVLQVALGQRPQIAVYGTDYPTRDGTAVRDYVHVTDLSTAHIKALQYLAKGGDSARFNLGSGKGFSVREVIEAARRVTGHPIPSVDGPRREGDPPSLVASSAAAEQVLGWQRKYATVDDIVASAWAFHKAHPHGYKRPAPAAAGAGTHEAQHEHGAKKH